MHDCKTFEWYLACLDADILTGVKMHCRNLDTYLYLDALQIYGLTFRSTTVTFDRYLGVIGI